LAGELDLALLLCRCMAGCGYRANAACFRCAAGWASSRSAWRIALLAAQIPGLTLPRSAPAKSSSRRSFYLVSEGWAKA
jgi:hypothetical protein